MSPAPSAPVGAAADPARAGRRSNELTPLTLADSPRYPLYVPIAVPCGVPALTLTDRGPILAAPWRSGSATVDAAATCFVSHTVFRYDRWRDLPLIGRDAEKAARLWAAQPGTVWLMQWFHPGRRLMGDLSVWQREDQLHDFLVLPEHTALVSRWRGRMHGTHHAWTGTADRTAIWRHAKPLIAE